MEEDKIVSIEERIPRLRESRKKKANRTLLAYLMLFFILIAIIVYLQSPFSNINEIIVNGNEVIPHEQIVEYSQINEGQNIWRIFLKEIEQSILEHPLVKEINVLRKFPQTILIDVKEKKIVGYVKSQNDYQPITEEGIIIPLNSKTTSTNVPIFNNFDDEQYLQRLAQELSETPDHILRLIWEIHWNRTDKNKYKIMLYMNDGFTVHATIRDFANKITSYPSVVSQLDKSEQFIIHMDVGVYVETIKK